MQNLRKVDPTFVNFTPSTAEEAVDRFVRCRRNGLKPYLIPECLIACAASLPAEEVERFESWIINPYGDLDSVKCAPCAAISQANDDTFTANAARVEGLLQQGTTELPPLPPLDDEKVPEPQPEMTMPSDR